MRKIYSLLFALLAFAGLANAQVVFDFSTDDAYTLFGLSGFSSGSGATAVTDGDITSDVSTTSSDVTITVTANPSGTVNRMWSGSLRLYGGTMTVSASRKNITAIKFTLNNSKWGANNSADCGTLETGSWAGNAPTVVITIAANTQIKKMEVFQEGDDTPVTIDWTSSATSPLTVAQVLQKGAQLDEGADSGKEVYVKGKISQITEIGTVNETTGEAYGNATYSISDDGSTSSELVVFRGFGLNGAKLAQGDINVGDEVVVVGKIKNFKNQDGSTTLEVNQGNKLYSLNGQTEGGDTPGPGPQPQVEYTPQGDGSFANPYNIDAIRSMDAQSTSEAVQTEVWVKAVVFGYITSSTLSENTIRTAPADGEEVTKSNLVLIDASHNDVTATPNIAYMTPVNLPTGDVRDALNLGDNSNLIGQTIWVCGDVLKYMGVPGLKNVKKYSLDGTTVQPGGDTPGPGPGPDPQTIDWTSSADAPLTVAQALEKASKLEGGADSGKDVYVKGKISQIDEISPKLADGSGYGNATYYISDDGTTTNQFYVYRGKSLNGADFTLEDEIKVGDEVVVVGVIKNYVKNETSTLEFIQGNKLYSLNGQTGGDTPEPEYLELPTIARAKAAATNAGNGVNAIFKANDLLVAYVNGKSVYVFDGTDGLLLYANSAATNEGIKTGDKVTADFKGQLKVYNGLTEIAVASIENLTVNSSNNTVTPQTVTIADITNSFADYENELVTIKDLTPAADAWASYNIAFTDDSDNELVVRDNWRVATALTFDTSKAYSVTGFVAIYANATATTVQLYPRAAEDIDNGEAPVVYEPTGDGQLSNAYTVEDVRHLGLLKPEQGAPAGWISGYIVGYVNGQSYNNGCVFSAEAPAAAPAAHRAEGEEPQVSNTNILLSDDPSCTDPAKCIPVQLANKLGMREALSLRDNPSYLHKKVWVEGTLTPYFSVAGVKEVVDWSFDGETWTTGVHAPKADMTSKAIYTVAGQRVSTIAQPGLYIIGGKKVLVK